MDVCGWPLAKAMLVSGDLSYTQTHNVCFVFFFSEETQEKVHSVVRVAEHMWKATSELNQQIVDSAPSFAVSA